MMPCSFSITEPKPGLQPTISCKTAKKRYNIATRGGVVPVRRSSKNESGELADQKGRVVEWQTRTAQNRVPQGMWVRLPPRPLPGQSHEGPTHSLGIEWSEFFGYKI